MFAYFFRMKKEKLKKKSKGLILEIKTSKHKLLFLILPENKFPNKTGPLS